MAPPGCGDAPARDGPAGPVRVFCAALQHPRVGGQVLQGESLQPVGRGPTEDVWNRPQHPYTRRLLASIPAADGLGRLPEIPDESD